MDDYPYTATTSMDISQSSLMHNERLILDDLDNRTEFNAE